MNNNEIIISGLGDAIESVFKYLGAKTCKACTSRKNAINRAFTFKVATKMDDYDFENFGRWIELKKEILTKEDKEYLKPLYHKSFKVLDELNLDDHPNIWSAVVRDLVRLYFVQLKQVNE